MNTSERDNAQTRKMLIAVSQYIDSLEGDISAEEQSAHFMHFIETLNSVDQSISREVIHRLYISTPSTAVLTHADMIVLLETQKHFLSLANTHAEHIQSALREPPSIEIQQIIDEAESLHDHCHNVADEAQRQHKETNSLTVALYLRAARLHSLEKTFTQ